MDKPYALVLAVLAALCIGCASKPLRLPTDFDAGQLVLVPTATEPELVLDGPESKASGGVRGAVRGGKTGLGVGALLCAAAGPFAGACIASLLPISGAIGAGTGAAVGTVLAETSDEVIAKRDLLQTRMAAAGMPVAVVRHMGRAARTSWGVELPVVADADGAAAVKAGWVLSIHVIELATQGYGSAKPYALELSVVMELVDAPQTRAPIQRPYQVQSPSQRTTEQWAMDGGAPVQAAIDEILGLLASKILQDLR